MKHAQAIASTPHLKPLLKLDHKISKDCQCERLLPITIKPQPCGRELPCLFGGCPFFTPQEPSEGQNPTKQDTQNLGPHPPELATNTCAQGCGTGTLDVHEHKINRPNEEGEGKRLGSSEPNTPTCLLWSCSLLSQRLGKILAMQQAKSPHLVRHHNFPDSAPRPRGTILSET